MRLHLPDVTVVIVDTVNYGRAEYAIHKTLEQIKPFELLFFTDIKSEIEGCTIIPINTITSKEAYSQFIVKELSRFIRSSHLLIIQSDGYVLDAKAWRDEFLEYDYVGAPWLYKDDRNVGNGGFSLRSAKLHRILTGDSTISLLHPEDEIICRLYRTYLESNYHIKFAPEDLAKHFSFELQEPEQPTFGFHSDFHASYRPEVVLSRSGAMGDIIMMEPVMEYFYRKGYKVILDCPGEFTDLFKRQHYPVFTSPTRQFPPNAKLINLDMAYEVRPKQLVLKSYYQACGIEDGPIRNAKINVPIHAHERLFDRYIVFHIDDTGMEHRNVRGINWRLVESYVKTMGYVPIQVGTGPHRIGTKINAASKNMLMYIIAGANLFVGIDSGPSHIAVASGIKSVIFFGSVNPEYRYASFENITIIQNHCEFAGCYHEVIGTTGQDCKLEKDKHKCITHTTDSFMEKLTPLL